MIPTSYKIWMKMMHLNLFLYLKIWDNITHPTYLTNDQIRKCKCTLKNINATQMALMLFLQLYKEFNHRIFKIIPVGQKYTLRNMGVVHRYILVDFFCDSSYWKFSICQAFYMCSWPLNNEVWTAQVHLQMDIFQ